MHATQYINATNCKDRNTLIEQSQYISITTAKCLFLTDQVTTTVHLVHAYKQFGNAIHKSIKYSNRTYTLTIRFREHVMDAQPDIYTV